MQESEEKPSHFATPRGYQKLPVGFLEGKAQFYSYTGRELLQENGCGDENDMLSAVSDHKNRLGSLGQMLGNGLLCRQFGDRGLFISPLGKRKKEPRLDAIVASDDERGEYEFKFFYKTGNDELHEGACKSIAKDKFKAVGGSEFVKRVVIFGRPPLNAAAFKASLAKDGIETVYIRFKEETLSDVMSVVDDTTNEDFIELLPHILTLLYESIPKDSIKELFPRTVKTQFPIGYTSSSRVSRRVPNTRCDADTSLPRRAFADIMIPVRQPVFAKFDVGLRGYSIPRMRGGG